MVILWFIGAAALAAFICALLPGIPGLTRMGLAAWGVGLVGFGLFTRRAVGAPITPAWLTLQAGSMALMLVGLGINLHVNLKLRRESAPP